MRSGRTERPAGLLRRSALAFVVGVFSFAVSTSAVAGASLTAKGPNPCKLLKRAEIERVLGQPTAAGKKGLTTAVSKTCLYAVSAGNDQPDGEVSTHVQTVGAKSAYDANSKRPGTERVTGIAKTYYDPRTGAMTTLAGNLLLTVQSVFIAIDGGVGAVDRKDETAALMKIAKKRL